MTSLACGRCHTLAVTDQGALYVWGYNYWGQLGTGGQVTCCTPTRVGEDLGRIVEVAASHYRNISAARTQDGKCYMWGWCRGEAVTSPRETPFLSLQEVFTHCNTPGVTYRSREVEMTTGPSVSDSLKMAFDDPETSDVKFVVEDREIHVHKAILKIRFEHLRVMFHERWEEGSTKAGCVPITQFSYIVYRAFLRYLYTDQVDLPLEDLLGLLELTNCYCEQHLKRKCEEIIQKEVTVENVGRLYIAAIKYQVQYWTVLCSMYHIGSAATASLC